MNWPFIQSIGFHLIWAGCIAGMAIVGIWGPAAALGIIAVLKSMILENKRND